MQGPKKVTFRSLLLLMSAVVIVAGTPVPALAAPPHRISIDDVTVAEGDTGTTDAMFTISYKGPNVASTVQWATADVTATAGSDYVASSGTASLPSGGCKCATISVPVIGDTLDEPDETFAVNLSNPSVGTIEDGEGLGSILDDDGVPSIVVGDTSADESAGPLVFEVTLSNPSVSTVTVDFATADDTATAGDDYVAAAGSLTFTPGDTSEVVNVTVIDDALAEGDESMKLDLSNPSGATIANGNAIGTIIDDDAPPALSVADIDVLEGDTGVTTGTFSVQLSKPHVASVTVDYVTVDVTALDDADYIGVAGTLTFDAGDTVQSVDVDVLGDVLAEDEETFEFQLSNAAGVSISDAIGVATILDDDPDPSLSVDDVEADEGAAASFTISLDDPAGRTVSVDYATLEETATEGDDYTGVTGTLTFEPGQTEQTVEVDSLDDAVFEGDETLQLVLTNPIHATLADDSGTGTIVDDDAAPTLSVDDVSVDEDAGSASFTVTKTGETALEASVDVSTVDGTSTAGEDYDAVNSTLVFSENQATVTVEVFITDDAIYEGDETFTLILTNPIDASLDAATGVATIVDDDAAPLLSIEDVSVVEGDSSSTNATFTVTLTGATDVGASVDVATVDGAARAGADFTAVATTLTIPVGGTSATFDVPILGDTIHEGDETFTVELSNPVDASIANGTATGTIVEDDKAIASMTLKVRKLRGKVVSRGIIEPAESTTEVVVTLQKRVGGKWKTLAKKRVIVTRLRDRDADGLPDAGYKASFSRPDSGRYRFVARVPATSDATAARRWAGVRL